jgi:hypothetical protein
MNDVRQAIRRAAEVRPIPIANLERVRRTVERRRRRRRITAGGVAFLVAAAGLVLVVSALRSPSSIGPAGLGGSELSPTPGDDGDGVHPVGPEAVVAQGVVSGKSWALIAYESNVGLCVDLELGDGRGGGCGFDVPEKSDLGLSVSSQAGVSKSIIHGVVSKRVAALVVRLDGGEELDLEIIEGPSAFGVKFFAAFLPPNAEGVVEARDDQGAVVQKERLRPLSGGRDDQEVFTEEVLDEHKLTLYYPEGWHRASETLTPQLDQPTELLSLGTYPLTPGGDDCVQIPERAIESLGPTDAFVTLQESSSGTGFPGHPNSFSAEGGEVSEAGECLDNADDIFFRIFRFTDEGRSFIAYVAIGDLASEQTRNEVWQVLNALIFCDPASPPGDCL